ncbi:hypothetical protein CFOLD11_44150 [Clostridium folliculivorans]|uniref:DUF3829 domain-containing protein n=1 Tax=Clostridium folliculivorans TaxID=2886038 RepID=A0A9W6DDM2_9CLOT|nr:hypothetical protein [Clostridium folliculivorans]GKU27588.1 hypothetical protein CFOLD11_44150 [Clostridium folliculivorans]
MKSAKKLLLLIALGSSISLLGCTAQKSQATDSVSKPQVTAAANQELSVDKAASDMRDIVKNIKDEIANKEDDKVAESSTKLQDSWKTFEDKFEEDLKDKYLDLYVKIEDPLGIIEAAAKVKPLDTKVLNKSLDNLDTQLAKLQNDNATTIGLENMKSILKELSGEITNKEDAKIVKTSEGLEKNWSSFEDGIKKNYPSIYEKVEQPLGTIQAAVKVTPLDTKVLDTSIVELDKVLEELQKSIAFSSGPQDMKTALTKIKKFISPLNEEKVTKYSDRLEKYWSSFEDEVKEKNKPLYEKVEAPLGTIQAAVKVKPIDEKVIKTASDSLDKTLTEIQNMK